MKKWVLLSVLLLVVTGVAQAIPNPAAVYCILQGYEYEIRTDEQGNQYGVCVFPDGSECGGWDYYCKCELNGIGCWPGNFTCHWPCKEMRCKEAGESVLVSKCCEGLDEIYPAHIFDANCNKLELVGWLFLCSDCGNGICESWESKCNCPEDCPQPRIIYVDADANGLNDGSSWADAYNYLQDALAAAASGDEIWVAQGIYKPDQGGGITPGDRGATFQLKNGVAIRGGYAGFGESDPNARDIELYETILSGDLNGNDIDVNNPTDLLDEPTRAENSFHVLSGRGTSARAVLKGFIIKGGNANSSSDWLDRCGGGIINFGLYVGMTPSYALASPTLFNCTFSKNSAKNGGGMYNYYGDPVLLNCKFNGNLAGRDGGGILNYVGSSPMLASCTFSGNFAGGMGGGMSNSYNSSPTLTNCILWGNTPQEIYVDHLSMPVVTYSDVQGGWLGAGNIDLDPCFADPGYWDPNGTPEDANDDFWIDGDYHLKSQAGRWDANEGRWTKDDVTSPCIDGGDMASPIGYEPFPNGGLINMGAYGGTTEASKSYFGEPVCETIIAGDINGDCKVNFFDFVLMAFHWLEEK